MRATLLRFLGTLLEARRSRSFYGMPCSSKAIVFHALRTACLLLLSISRHIATIVADRFASRPALATRTRTSAHADRRSILFLESVRGELGRAHTFGLRWPLERPPACVAFLCLSLIESPFNARLAGPLAYLAFHARTHGRIRGRSSL